MNLTFSQIAIVVHYITALACLACLMGFGVVDPNGWASTAIQLLIGAGVGGGLVMYQPTNTTANTPVTRANTAAPAASPAPAIVPPAA